jgi:ribonuclease Z
VSTSDAGNHSGQVPRQGAVERPVENAPYVTITHSGLTIQGWSRAAVQSYWRICELNVGLDCGAQPWDFMGTPNWFLTHTHLDHMAALPVYIARRRMMKMEPPRVYVPLEMYDDIRRLLLVMQRLDRGRQTVELQGVQAGDVIELNRNHLVTVHQMQHTVPSRGYIIWERRKKLKEEYTGLSGEQIRDLRYSGVEVTREVRIPLVAYTGDTAPGGLDANPEFYEAKILITELSFLRAGHRREKIHKYGHMHLDDIAERAERFRNELVILGHFSTRYHPREVRRVLEAKLPDGLRQRVRLCV